jgi:prepilin-type N-terminal cleavage/methylation domain-containing protein
MKKTFNLGFTLIELLVVISLIGILSALALVSFTGAQKQARDSQRKSDLKQYQTAVESFANKNNGFYPARNDEPEGVSFVSIICSLVELTSCTEDPRYTSDNTFYYHYQSDAAADGTITATKYVLWAKLENTTNYWVNCSNGRSGTKAQTGFDVSGGVCPL